MNLLNTKRSVFLPPFCLLLVGTAIVFTLNTFYPTNTFFHVALVIFGGTLFFSSGMLFAFLLEYFTKRKFELWEFITFSILGILIFFPLLLQIEFFALGYIYDWFPLFNVFAVTLLVLLVKTSSPLSLQLPNIKHLSFFLRNNFFSSPLPFFFLFLIFISLIVLTYPALPDLDPYKWLFKYSYQFPNQVLDTIERPFFGALTFIGVKLLDISILTFFKYVFPFLLSFVVFPAWLLARNIPDPLQRSLFMGLLFTSPVVLLYGTTAMPQTPLIILTYFFLFFCLYSYIKKDAFYFYMAGAAVFFGYFYHPAAAIIFAGFAGSLLIHFRRSLLKDRKALFLIGLLLVSNYERILQASSFLTNWTSVVLSRFFFPDNVNLIFPSYYRNIDNTTMGWPGFEGIIKYYAFHVGPGVSFILIVLLWLLSQKHFRQSLFSSIKKVGVWLPMLSFFPFFIISEILPRFPNVALLPDRSWIFGGIFSLTFAFLFLHKEKLPRWLLFIGIISILINVGGAFYINNLKKYLITPIQWRSAEWIVKNLPESRIFLSSGNKNLLPVHAESRLLKLPENLYCDDIKEFDQYLGQIDPENLYVQTLKKSPNGLREDLSAILTKQTQDLEKAQSIEQKKVVLHDNLQLLQQEIAHYDETLKLQPGLPLFSPPGGNIPHLDKAVPIENIYRGNEFNYTLNSKDVLYIYFSRMDERNPYGSRPYTLNTWGFRGCSENRSFIFDQYPEKFKRIYNDREEVIIWEIR